MTIRWFSFLMLIPMFAGCPGDDTGSDTDPDSEGDSGEGTGTGTAIPVGTYFVDEAVDMTGGSVRTDGDAFEFLIPEQWDEATGEEYVIMWMEAEVVNTDTDARFIDCSGRSDTNTPSCTAFTGAGLAVGEAADTSADLSGDPVGLTVPMSVEDDSLFIDVGPVTYEVVNPTFYVAVRDPNGEPFRGEFPTDTDTLIGVLESL